MRLPREEWEVEAKETTQRTLPNMGFIYLDRAALVMGINAYACASGTHAVSEDQTVDSLG